MMIPPSLTVPRLEGARQQVFCLLRVFRGSQPCWPAPLPGTALRLRHSAACACRPHSKISGRPIVQVRLELKTLLKMNCAKFWNSMMDAGHTTLLAPVIFGLVSHREEMTKVAAPDSR